MKKADFPYYLTSFLGKYLPGQKNASPNTIESYATTFKLLLVYCEEKKKVKPERLNLSFLTRDTIIGFLDWIEQERNCSISTRNQRLVPLHSFSDTFKKSLLKISTRFRKYLTSLTRKHLKQLCRF